jgi:hypothetical protein
MKTYTVEEFLLTYMSWLSMTQRCNYPGREDFDRYKGRGIAICTRWKKFENFIEDMGPRPAKNLTLDRADKDGNYEPGNCRWATAKQQANNTCQTKMITSEGKTQSVSEWAREKHLVVSTLSYRLRTGWPVTDALNAPEGGHNRAHSSFAEGRASGKKLTQEQVRQIVAKARDGKHTARGLGVEYSVSGSAICHILKQFNIRLKKGRPKC